MSSFSMHLQCPTFVVYALKMLCRLFLLLDVMLSDQNSRTCPIGTQKCDPQHSLYHFSFHSIICEFQLTYFRNSFGLLN